MGQNIHGRWNDADMAACITRFEKAKRKLDEKQTKEYNRLVDKLVVLENVHRLERNQLHGAFMDERNALVQLWEVE